MKKLLTILMAILVVVTAVACTTAPQNDDVDNDVETNDDVVVNTETETETETEVETETEAEAEEETAPEADEEPSEEETEEPLASEPEAEQTPVETPEVSAPVEDETPVEPEEAPDVEETPEAEEVPEAEETPAVEVSVDTLYAIADTMYNGISPDTMPMVMSMELTEEDFQYHTFAEYKDGYIGLVNMPMMGSIAHKVVLVATPDEASAKAVAAEMEANADPSWLICATARAVKTASKGNIAVLVMTDYDAYDEALSPEEIEEKSVALANERATIIVNNILGAIK